MNPSLPIYRIVVILRLLLGVGVLALVLWLLNQAFVPSGKLTLRYQPGVSEPAAFEQFASKEKDVIIGQSKGSEDLFQLITQEPVYFTVKVPRPFAKATVKVTYQNPNQQPEIKLGVVQKNSGIFFTPLSVQSSLLETVPEYWNSVREGDVVLYQKDPTKQAWTDEFAQLSKDIQFKQDELTRLGDLAGQVSQDQLAKQREAVSREIETLRSERIAVEDRLADWVSQPAYASVDDFLHQPAAADEIATYNYDLSNVMRLDEYQPSASPTVISSGLRGSHTLYTYIKNETLDFVFSVQELNRYVGEDECLIELWQGTRKISSQKLDDDGNVVADGKASPVHQLKLRVPDLAEGTYQIKIVSRNEEHLIRRIETTQHLLTFNDHIYLSDNEEYRRAIPDIIEEPTTLYGGGGAFTVRTSHQAGYQTLTVENEKLNITEVQTEYATTSTSWPTGLRRIVSPRNNVFIKSNGYFSFAPEQYFDPTLGVANVNNLKSLDSLSYVIATYPKKESTGGWITASQTVSVPNLYTENNRVRFLLNLPGLAENRRVLKIKEIEITFEKEPVTFSSLWDKLSNRFK